MGKLLPQLELPKVLDGFDSNGAPKLRPAKGEITLRHLLTHTAGFTYSTWSEPMTKYEKVTGTPFVGECKNATFNLPLEFDPGERWQYGINMDWVGKAVEAVSDQSLEIYFRENIFAPLGMTDTGFLISSAQKARVAPMSQREQDGTLKPMAFEMPQRPEFFMGGGGLFSTPRNYMAFLQMLLHEGTFNGARVLKPETIALMQQNHIGDLDVADAEDDATGDLARTPTCFPAWCRSGASPGTSTRNRGRRGAAPAAWPGPGCSTPISGLIRASA